MTTPKREIIYIDIEDEITSIIDKVVSADSKILGLVPPKRASMLQSIVNMKLLKRSADQAGKKIVLVTNESSLLPLAGLAGVYVAKNLQSRPYIPKSPGEREEETNTDELEVKEADSSVGALAAASGKEVPLKENIDELPEDVPEDLGELPEDKPVVTKKKSKKDKSPKIPNFNSFRTRVLLVGGIFALILVGYFVLYRVLPKGSVEVKAETSRVPVSGSISAALSAKSDDVDKAILQSENKQIQKTLSQDFSATGTKNTGNKATGTMTVTNCDSTDSITLPAGTSFTAGNFVFKSTAAATIPGSGFSGGGKVCKSDGKATINVTADQAGDTYNLGPRAYTVSGVSANVTASGAQMAGGTTQNVKVVSEEDVNAAKQKIAGLDSSEVKDELTKQFGDSFVIVDSSFTNSQGQATISPAVGAEGESGKVTLSVTYNLLGIRKDSLRNYIENLAKKQYDADQQKVYDDGIKNAVLKLDKKVDDNNYTVSLSTDVYVGPQISESELAEKISGKRVGEAEELIRKTPGVRDVRVRVSPFYVKTLPKPAKISVTFDVEPITTSQ